MNIKKVLLITVLLAMIFLPQTNVFAAPEAVFSVETNKTAIAGNSFTVDISIEQNPGFAGLTLDLTYNRKYMILQKVEYSSALDDFDATVSMSSNTDDFPYVLQIESDDNIVYTGVLFTATFVLDASATLGDYPIEISCADGKMFDKDFGNIDSETVSGGVSIECLHNYETNVVESKCDAKGYTEYRCTECRAYYQGDWTDETAHNWKTISSTKPTCTENGVLNRECRACGREETVNNGDALGHSYNSGVIVPSNCSEEGYTLHKCKNCSYEYRDEYTPTSDHTYEGHITQAPTCQQVGYKKYVCSVCEISYTDEIQKSDCKYEQTLSQEATHDSRGWTAYECIYCGATKKDNYTDVIPYDFQYEAVVKPTCTQNGLRRGVCKDGCGYTVEENIYATGHLYNDWYVEKEATEEHTGVEACVCVYCNDKITRELPKIVYNDPISKIGGVFDLSKKQMTVLAVAFVLVLLVIVMLAVFLKRINGSGKKRKKKRRK